MSAEHPPKPWTVPERPAPCDPIMDPIMYRCLNPACSCNRPGSDFHPRPTETPAPVWPVELMNAVEHRVPRETLVALTNPTRPTATEVDGGVFAIACSDVAAEMRAESGERVVAKLRSMAGVPGTPDSDPNERLREINRQIGEDNIRLRRELAMCACGRAVSLVEENGDWNIMKAADAPELVILDREGTKCGKCGGELVCLTCANKKWREEVAIPALTRLPSRLVEIATAACWVLAGFALAAVSHQAGWFATLFGR